MDRTAFKCGHRLLGHPALSLEHLARALPSLPPGRVTYSSGRLDPADDIDRVHFTKRNGLSLEDTLATLPSGNSFVMVRAPESEPSLRGVFEQLLADVQRLCAARGANGGVIDPMLYLFLASPNSVTPFHIDRYTSLLLQFQGRKQVTVCAPWDERVLSPRAIEAYVTCATERPEWRPELEERAQRYDFGPGDALHIPFVAGHHVQNGPEQVSISLSIMFRTSQTARQLDALKFNYKARKALGRFGVAPTPVGRSERLDHAKARCMAAARRLFGHETRARA